MDRQITPSMINNYVKGEVLPAPVSKKYSKEHLAFIEEICTLKQVLSIAEVKQVLDQSYENTDKSETFNHFNEMNSEKTSTIVNEAFKLLNDVDENDYKKLNDIALEFAITANCYINIAKRILYLTRQYQYHEELEKHKKHDEKEEN